MIPFGTAAAGRFRKGCHQGDLSSSPAMEFGLSTVVLIGHSGEGWIAMAYLLVF
jgi:hypothetical protein